MNNNGHKAYDFSRTSFLFFTCIARGFDIEEFSIPLHRCEETTDARRGQIGYQHTLSSQAHTGQVNMDTHDESYSERNRKKEKDRGGGGVPRIGWRSLEGRMTHTMSLQRARKN